MTAHISRRKVVGATAWAVPAVAVASAAPAIAASSPTGLTDLAIDVALPPTDPASGDYVLSDSIYKSDRTTVATKASLSTTITVTNVGSVPANNPTGTIDLQLFNYGTDVPFISTEARKFNIDVLTPGVVLTPIAPLTYPGSGNNYQWSYVGTLNPGETLTLTLRYWVSSPFAHATATQMLVSAMVNDQTQNDYDDNSAKTNYAPSFAA